MSDDLLIVVIHILNAGAKIQAYDPKAINEAKNCYLKGNKNVEYCESKYTTLVGAEAMILVTEWKEFRAPDFQEIKQRLNAPVIFDGRNQYDKDRMKELGFEYYQIGVKDDLTPENN